MNPMASYDDLGSENFSISGNSTEGGTPGGNETPGGNDTPTEGGTPGGNEAPSGNEIFAEGGNPSGNETPGENETPGGNETPSGDVDAVQAILDDLRANLCEKDSDVDSLVESVRSLVDVMSIDSTRSTPGYVYVPPEIPIEGYKGWDYPITVDYLISIVGYGDPLPQSNTYDEHEQFLEDFQDLAWNCYKGDVFTEFIINKVWDANNKKLYDSQGMEESDPEEPTPEEPLEDLTSAMLDALQSMDARLESLYAGLSTLSENTISYQEDALILQEQNNTLQFHLLVASMALGFTLFLVLGYIIAHGFWQRMRSG